MAGISSSIGAGTLSAAPIRPGSTSTQAGGGFQAGNAGLPADSKGPQGSTVKLSAQTLTVKLGEEAELTASVSGISDQSVTWTSSLPSLAAVDSGKITAKGCGVARITATAADGGWASCIVSVTMDPIRLTGKGDKTLEHIHLPAGAYAARIIHNGKKSFIVRYGDEHHAVKQLAVNKVGEYAGVVLFRSGRQEQSTQGRFEIRADGEWSITLLALSSGSTSTMKGDGDMVAGLIGGTGKEHTVQLSHEGKGNCTVRLYELGAEKYGYEILMNEIGPKEVTATCRLETGKYYFLEILADGVWSIDFGMGEQVTEYLKP